MHVFTIHSNQRLFDESDVEELVVEDHSNQSDTKATPDHKDGDLVEPESIGFQPGDRNGCQKGVFDEHREVKCNHFGTCIILRGSIPGEGDHGEGGRRKKKWEKCELKQRANKGAKGESVFNMSS